MKQRTIALAGVLQAARLVNQIAATGSADGQALQTAIDSVFRIDAESPVAVYGDPGRIEPMLRALVAHLDGSARDPVVTRIAATVLHVERKLARRPDMLAAISSGIESARRQREHLGEVHPTVLARLGELYAATVSQLRPRVLVQGNPQYLAQSDVVAEIRAMLLASVRSAVLWRQLGGSYLDLLVRRRRVLEAARSLLAGADST
ncbi:MAG TPA: high frequency lysogenization protein HflD [Xanthomonadaceae bacterium]|nr:high frequency lysogenization protein HflD [Xanthomonadaceae bacterium]